MFLEIETSAVITFILYLKVCYFVGWKRLQCCLELWLIDTLYLSVVQISISFFTHNIRFSISSASHYPLWKQGISRLFGIIGII